ncbi:UDP-glucose 4-epimerase [Bacillus sp. FJAT-27264]|uniref:NAD-dependent epimerase/dehydratase family protein n=1 Tax=Paenibacillus sp. (strain DSM 101736 / FJAT-27264) TaxID=1850362 RepID=UPI000808109C|nr:NAD-dependent epimerase/dehydratase family protein [Bacillus sp. FJAT-27264]OBZ07839.1 UDP-glucose 4-epimerase [Bacillus sp. FJAT-27264]
MKSLVTGGCGFIGSHIVDELIQKGHEVLVIDNLSTGSKKNLNESALFYELDFMSIEAEKAILEFGPEIVFHHAAQVSVQKSMDNPLNDANINILGTIKLLEYCSNAGVRKLVYPSSAAIYGNPEQLPISEDHKIAPVSFYGISKYTPEQYIRAFCSNHSLSFTILRYANVYGERQDAKGEGGVVSIFLDRLLNKGIPVIYGDGEQTRDFIYVKDIVSANLFVIDSGDNEVFNVSTGKGVTLNKLLDLMNQGLNNSTFPMYDEFREGDILASYLDNSKLKKMGWSPKFDIENGLSNLIKTIMY